MNKILGKICVVLATIMPLLFGLGIVLVAVILQLEISLSGVAIMFPILGIFSLTVFLKNKKEIIEALKS